MSLPKSLSPDATAARSIDLGNLSVKNHTTSVVACSEPADVLRSTRLSDRWGSLTPTELEVTALVKDGLSNPEIATRLLMGRGTVKTHLAHIFSKLQVSNRSQLATLASRRVQEGH